MKRLRTAILAALAATAAHTAHAAFEELGAGARAPGMGDAFVALADDVYAIHYNPAGLGLLTRPEMGASYTKLVTGLTDNSNVSHMFLGYAHPLPKARGTVATQWEQLSLNSSLYSEQQFGLGYARGGWGLGPGRLAAGGSLKYLRRGFGSFPEAANSYNGIATTGRPDPVLSGRNSVGKPDADLGLLYHFRRRYSLGMAVRHALQPNMSINPSDNDKIPMIVTLGLNHANVLSNLGVQYETLRAPTGARDHAITFAAERWIPRVLLGDFGLRGALGLGTRDRRQFTMGLSYRAGRLTVDYGFALWASAPVSTSGSHRLALSLRFGSLSEPDESVVMLLEAMQRIKKGNLPELTVTAMGLTAEQKAQVDEYVAIAKSLQAEAKYQAALERLGQALGVSPGDTALLKSYARLNWVAQQVKGLPSYKTDPVQAAWHQGILAYISADDEGAIKKTSEAFALDRENKGLDGFLAQLELATGLHRPDLPAVSPKRMRIEQNLAQANAALEDGRYDEAISLSRQVLAEDSDNVAALENLGTAYFAIGDYSGSLDAWERAYALERPARRAALEGHMKQLRALLARKRAEAAASEAAKAPAASDLSPREIRKLYNEGIDYYASGQLQRARESFERVLKADPNYTPARKALRRVMEEMR
ncbi:MAG: tetratricopeptide repeat protein [Elusimicrobia bacterium]|nr:tetratricopeptide repeat protein [Elusimicrobiota bacterium]